jgi:hypothetical protein
MLWPGRNDSWKLLARRLCAVVALLSYLATIGGVPLPSVHGKDQSQPFPCQDHPCGCLTAEQCWRHCCCFTPEEKWVWAQAQHVEPPAYAEVSPPRGWQTPRLRDQVDGGGTACRACFSPTEKEAASAASCVSERNCCAVRSSVPSCTHAQNGHCGSKETQTRVGLRWVHGMSMFRCHGFSTQWVSAGAVITPPPGPSWSAPTTPSSVLSYRDASPFTVCHAPLPPPPRSLSA